MLAPFFDFSKATIQVYTISLKLFNSKKGNRFFSVKTGPHQKVPDSL